MSNPIPLVYKVLRMEGLVSVIVLCYGKWYLTEKFLQSFFSWLDFPSELIVLDNGSPDGGETWNELNRISQGWNHIWLKDYQLLQSEENLGVPGGWNFVVKYSKGDYFLFSNNDLTFGGPFVTPMLTTLKMDSKVGCTGWWHMVWSGIPFIEGSCWMIPRNVWEQVGEFDEKYWPGTMEDVDWQVRMRSLGWVERRTPGIRIDHVKHQSRSGVIGPLEERKNKLYFCGKFGYDLSIVE